MALITRISRLFRADIHAVLDRIEEPDVLLKQALREMEQELAQDEHRLKVLSHEQEQLVARRTDIDQSLIDIGEELDVCFASNQEELARSMIRRRLEAERFGKYLSRRCKTLQQEISGLSLGIKQNRARLESMRQKEELLAEEDSVSRREELLMVPDISVREEEVEVALLREKQKRRGS